MLNKWTTSPKKGRKGLTDRRHERSQGVRGYCMTWVLCLALLGMDVLYHILCPALYLRCSDSILGVFGGFSFNNIGNSFSTIP